MRTRIEQNLSNDARIASGDAGKDSSQVIRNLLTQALVIYESGQVLVCVWGGGGG